jgi:hypothetical protein
MLTVLITIAVEQFTERTRTQAEAFAKFLAEN